MWRPDDVVSEHKRRGIALWIILIVGIVTYASWLLAAALEKRANPSTSRVLSNKIFPYPDTWVCLYDTYGCDDLSIEEECIRSLNQTEGGKTTAVYYPGGYYEYIVPAVPKRTPNGWCVHFETSNVDNFVGQDHDATIGEYQNLFILDMYWYPGGAADRSTTCVPGGEEWTPHGEWVYLFLVDPASNLATNGIQMPYSCITEESNSHISTYLGLGLTEERNFNKDDSVAYKAMSVTSSVYKDSVKPNITSPYARLSMEIRQEPNSWEIVTEIDPLDVAEMLGNIGGFWDLLLILWPLFFVAVTRRDPYMKPRDFKKIAGWAVESARIAASTAGVPRPLEGATSFNGLRSSAGGQEQPAEPPYWGTTVSPQRQQSERKQEYV